MAWQEACKPHEGVKYRCGLSLAHIWDLICYKTREENAVFENAQIEGRQGRQGRQQGGHG